MALFMVPAYLYIKKPATVTDNITGAYCTSVLKKLVKNCPNAFSIVPRSIPATADIKR